MANIKHNLIIKSSAQHVYNMIASEDGLRSWWTTQVTAEPKEGFINHFKFGEEYFNKMKVLLLKPNEEIVWDCVDGDKEWIGTKVAFVLNEQDGQTRLSFSHLNWQDETEFFASCTYQWGRFLTTLKDVCETGKGQLFNVQAK